MSSSQDSNKRPSQDDPPSLPLAEVRASALKLVKVCGSNKLSLESLQKILDEFPRSAISILRDNHRAWFPYRDPPLNAACGNKNVDVNIVKALLDFWPESASVKNSSDGRYPTHALCENKSVQDVDSLEILKLLAAASPDSLRIRDNSECLPIHIAASRKGRDFCKILVGVYPESVRMPIAFGTLPIHCACTGDCLDTVKYLLDLAPESIHARDIGGKLPIHYAAMDCSNHDENVNIVRFLLNQDPACASMATDSNQDLPLHSACASFRANLETIKLLFDSFPEALVTENRGGNTPLDLKRRRTTNQLADFFLETQMAYARQARNSIVMTTPDSKGWLPLHCALHAKASLGAIKLLVNGNEGALRAASSYGSLPLHIACQFSTVDVVKFLVEAYEGLNHCDNDGSSPLHRACLGGNCSVVRYLIESHGTSVSTHNAHKHLPIHLIIDSDVDHNSLAYQEAIFLLIRAHPGSLNETDISDLIVHVKSSDTATR